MASVDWNVNSKTIQVLYDFKTIKASQTEIRKLKQKNGITHNKCKIPASIVSQDTKIDLMTIIKMHFKINNYPMPDFLKNKKGTSAN